MCKQFKYMVFLSCTCVKCKCVQCTYMSASKCGLVRLDQLWSRMFDLQQPFMRWGVETEKLRTTAQLLQPSLLSIQLGWIKLNMMTCN